MQTLIDQGEIRVGRRNEKQDSYTLNHWKPRSGERVQRVRTVWWRTSHDAGTHGTTLLQRMLERRKAFAFPKSLYAVRDCLETVLRDRKDATIIDFFAGSGTTLHSTLLLNEADQGRRRCILVTNNEVDGDTADEMLDNGLRPGDPDWEARGVFESVTRPRIKAAITGKAPSGKAYPAGKKYRYLDGRQWSEGFAARCEFFRIDYLNPDRLELGNDLGRLLTLMWLRAGAIGLASTGVDLSQPFVVVPENGYAVLTDDGALDELVDAIKSDESIGHIFLVTDWPDAFAEMTQAIGPTRKTTMIPRDYLRHCRKPR